MRIFLLIAVIALVVDALFFSGAYTQSAYRHVTLAADQLVALIGDAVDDASPDRESSIPTRRI